MSNLKKVLSLLLVAILVIPARPVTSIAEAETEADIPVLLYHRVLENPTNEWTDTSIEKFEKTMQYLHDNGYNTLSAEEYVNIMEGTEAAPENPILLTFDDATPDFIDHILPILNQYNMKSVLFVVSDWIGDDYSMSLEQFKSLLNEPNVSLENHSKTHDEDNVWNDSLTKAQADEEIAAANEFLKSHTNKDPLLMAYPYGTYNADAELANEENGIKYAFKVGYPNGSDYAMGRHYIMMDTTLEEIATWVGGPAPESEPEETVEETPESNIVFHETFDGGLGIATQAGNAQLDHVSDLIFEGNDDGEAVHVSNRTNNYDGIDINFSDASMENGKTYTITINGYIDDSTTTPDGSQALLQNVDSYNGLYVAADLTAGESFTLTGEYTVDTSADRALRIQSNDAATTVPFYIGDILITEAATPEDNEEEPVDPVDPDESEEDAEPTPPAESLSTITFEDQSQGAFEGRAGTETLTVTDEANHTDDGSYALKVEDRTDTWHGPMMDVAAYVEEGQEYTISAWVKLIAPETSQLQLSTQVGQGDSASYNNIQGKTISTEDGWVQLEGTYRYSSLGDGNLSIYVESSNNSTASFYIDDISFEPTGTGDVEIEKELAPIKDVYKDYFLIGNAISNAELEGTRLELLNMHHNLVTAENAMKPGYAYNDDREFDFTAEDELVNKAAAEGLDIHGHVLIWHQQSDEWLHSDENGDPLSREEALQNLKTHVKTTVEHFGPRVISWDVVNEAMNDNPSNPSDWKASLRQSGWYKAIGEDYIEQAFLAAKEVINENGWDIKLYYNDYNDDNQNKAEAIYQMVKEINQNYGAENDGALLIEGIGMQAHYNLNTSPENVRRSMEKFISLGVEVGVTELDITAGSDNELTEQQANAQGYLYAQLFNLYKEHAEHISRVTLWGLNDATSWRAEQSPLLFDNDLQAKPAYYAVIDPDAFIAEHEPTENEANQGSAVFGTPEIDGSIDGIWSDATELPINRYQTAWQGANGTAKTLWDNENLYVLIQVSDSDLDKTNENAWEQDSVEVFVDENNAKTSFYEDEDGQYRVNFDNETSFNPASISEGFESATYKSANGYTVEMKIPFKTISPESNTKVGFDVQINDAKDGSRQSAATWNDTTGAGYQDTSVFGELTLLQAAEEEAEPEEPDTESPDEEEPKEEKPKDENSDSDKSKAVKAKVSVKENQASIKDGTIDKVEVDGELLIDVSKQDASINISLTKEQVKQLKEKNATINILLKDVSIQLPASIFTNGDEAVVIEFEKMKDIAEALSAVYDFKIMQGDQEISKFDENVTLSFNIDESKMKNADLAKIFYWNPDTKNWELIGGEYKDGVVTGQTNHFSTFTVLETEETEVSSEAPVASDEQILPDTATSTFNYLLAGLFMLVIGAGFLLIKRRKAQRNTTV
ncbi:endo-1,4-beta-xylanase [Saliterribacillus persicus]|uniref:Beta-xylanase n=1 Tax=Saliterribacillus persicus TaxID=930114 RepID=A0A368YB91_9BACI|nr:endo-1,4-beta-xylanase [Saliterribacillus persicus]